MAQAAILARQQFEVEATDMIGTAAYVRQLHPNSARLKSFTPRHGTTASIGGASTERALSQFESGRLRRRVYGIAINKPPLIPMDRSCPRPKSQSNIGSIYQPNLCFLAGQYMKSAAASAAREFVVVPFCRVRTYSGPTPSMSSAFLERVQGFLSRRSVSHSVLFRK